MKRLWGAVLLSSTSYTAFMAALAWEALRIGNRAGAPASVFAFSALTSLCAAPLSGVWVDRLGARRAYIVSQWAVAVLLAVAAGARALGSLATLPALLLLAGLHGVASAMTNPAMHGLMQTRATPETATALASRSGVFVALGFIAGYSGGGMLVDYSGFVVTLLVCGGLSVLVSGSIASLRATPSAPRQQRATSKGWHELSAGFRYLFGDRRLREAAIAYVLCYAIFHTVTALLPPFSKLVLSVDAARFGFLRAAWSVGSACGSLALTLLWGRRRAGASSKFAAVAVLGSMFVVFGASRTFQVALVLIAFVGVTHAACRALLDGYLLELCESRMIGRVRGLVNSLISGVSLVVFAASSGVEASWIGTIFITLGLCVSATSSAIYLRHRLARELPDSARLPD